MSNIKISNSAKTVIYKGDSNWLLAQIEKNRGKLEILGDVDGLSPTIFDRNDIDQIINDINILKNYSGKKFKDEAELIISILKNRYDIKLIIFNPFN